MASEDFTTEAAEGERDRRFHGGAPAHLDDDELARRTEAEQLARRDALQAGLANDGGEQLILGTEMRVQRCLGDTGRPRHRIHADRAIAARSEQFGRSIQDGAPLRRLGLISLGHMTRNAADRVRSQVRTEPSADLCVFLLISPLRPPGRA